jgi:hypothetical protein
VGYQRRRAGGLKEWLFPDETLAESGGDCEDHAFLLAATLLASGLSGYVVRVALGQLRDTTHGGATDHAWVMYKSEAGHWLLLDPLLYTQDGKRRRPGAKVVRRATSGAEIAVGASTHEYVPRFVFNDEHLWAVCERGDTAHLPSYLEARAFWAEFDPSFAASVHDSIFDEALHGMEWADLQWVKSVSLGIDANTAIYDPRDHFDNAYVPDAWARVQQRLASRELSDFALACHAIGDFYAHTSWGTFGARDANGTLLPLLDASSPAFATTPDYSEDLGRYPIDEDGRFTVNDPVWGARPREEAVADWNEKLISGRYAQASDPHQGTFERITNIPKELTARDDYAPRTGLPHHNEVAVDSATRSDAHKLYSASAYGDAFRERYAAAVAHVKDAYARWKP